ncbi:MAG: ribbon-helix-helix protein, CopG family [Nitrospirae bacterium]|nr:ribbon-helix-helix protein, CopG family [Nitrospirota bacterium]
MSKAVKLAISISSEDFKAIETIRKREGITRSGVVREAIRLLRNKTEKDRLIRLYEEGYRKHPESLQEIKAKEKASLEALSQEDWN